MNRSTLICAGFCLALSASVAHSAARITIVNNDGAGEGFNDTTPRAPEGGNRGVTVGEQRRIAFETAAAAWSRVINSPVEILIRGQFDPQTCSAGGATLGSAGAVQIFSNFANAPRANRFYSVALANSLAGTDLSPAQPDINATFNVSLDSECLGAGTGWYYGIDPSFPIPTGKTALMPVLLHEFGHGLGFQSFASRTTGAFSGGSPDVWSEFQRDNQTGVLWVNMTDGDRLISQVNDPFLVWTGPKVTEAAQDFLLRPIELEVVSPPVIAGNNPSVVAAFGPQPDATGISGSAVASVPADGCTAFSNSVTGQIAVVARGTCSFKTKVLNAQIAGAIGVVIFNNAATGSPPMGDDAAITTPILISSVGVTQALGNSILANLPATVRMFRNNASPLSGTNGGFVRLHAPNPVVAGSSVSHFSVDTLPNTLMEPAINFNLFNRVDLTKPLFEDLGWNTPIFNAGFEVVD